MTLILDLDAAQERELETLARSEGLPLTDYALRRLLPSQSRTGGKPFRALQFSGASPTGRTAEEIDADIRDLRNEWEKRERFLQSVPKTPAE